MFLKDYIGSFDWLEWGEQTRWGKKNFRRPARRYLWWSAGEMMPTWAVVVVVDVKGKETTRFGTG